MATVEHQQYDMFKGKLVDNRTRKQREEDKARSATQSIMFCQRDIALFGVNGNPLFPLSPNMLLPMMMEDPRTEEEIEADRMKAALRLTTPLFPLDDETETIPEPVTAASSTQPHPLATPERPSPPAPPGQFAVQHRFAPSSHETPKREKIIWQPTTKPAAIPEIMAETTEANEIDPKNEVFCRVAVKAKAFELRKRQDALANTSLLFTLLLAHIEAQAVEITETEITLALRIGQAAAQTTRRERLYELA